jgi:hypothetical protein
MQTPGRSRLFLPNRIIGQLSLPLYMNNQDPSNLSNPRHQRAIICLYCINVTLYFTGFWVPACARMTTPLIVSSSGFGVSSEKMENRILALATD